MYTESEFIWLIYLHFAIVFAPAIAAPFVFLYEKNRGKKAPTPIIAPPEEPIVEKKRAA